MGVDTLLPPLTLLVLGVATKSMSSAYIDVQHITVCTVIGYLPFPRFAD